MFSDEERDADKFTSELSEVKIGKFDHHTCPTKLFICIDVIIYMYILYYRSGGGQAYGALHAILQTGQVLTLVNKIISIRARVLIFFVL